MASSPQLAIAKASLSAALLRADPTACSRDEIEHFHVLLNSAIARCSPTNVQKCKQWTLRHIARSPARVTALAKFLVSLAESFAHPEQHKTAAAPAGNGTVPAPAQPQKPSAKRRRLHLLYIISDILHHTHARDRDDTFAAGLEQALPALFKHAASFAGSPKHAKKLHDLVAIWEQKGYLPSEGLPAKLREAIAAGPAAAAAAAATLTGAVANSQENRNAGGAPASGRGAPFLLPSTHGDPSTAWYDLPAANWLPVLQPNSTRPVDPAQIKPLQLRPGAADNLLVDAVKRLLADVDRLYAPDLGVIAAADEDDPSVDVDQMGERVELDEITGEVLGGATYYGWSRDFCRKMKARRKQGRAGHGGSRSRSRHSRDGSFDNCSQSRGRDRGRDSSYSRSRERGRSPGGSQARSTSRPVHKRRRVSLSQSRSHSRDRRGTGRSRSRSRSYSPDRYQRRSKSRSYAPSKSRSRSRDHRPRSTGPGRKSASPGYSPPPAAAMAPTVPFPGMPPHMVSNMPPNAQFPPPSMPPVPFPPPPPHMMPPIPMPQFPGQGFGAFPTQPPFQPYPGQWPAPVPPPLPHSHNLAHPPPMGGAPMQGQGWLPPRPDPQGGWIGGWGGPVQQQPPPPQSPSGSPQAHHAQQYQQNQGGYQHQYGRGGGMGGYRGQPSGRGGGYNSGRGRGW